MEGPWDQRLEGGSWDAADAAPLDGRPEGRPDPACHLVGLLPPGQAFSITEVAEQLHVSRIPVRGALQQLEKEGLVQLRARRSAVVRPD